jgi:hypothetical protein
MTYCDTFGNRFGRALVFVWNWSGGKVKADRDGYIFGLKCLVNQNYTFFKKYNSKERRSKCMILGLSASVVRFANLLTLELLPPRY